MEAKNGWGMVHLPGEWHALSLTSVLQKFKIK
jgi:hypothetical protein